MAKECHACKKSLKAVLTMQGVEVDLCPQCNGVWLDKDEIFLLSKDPDHVLVKFKEALGKKVLSQTKSPVSQKEMVQLPLFDGKLNIDYCMQSGGVWLEKEQIDKLSSTPISLEIDRGGEIENVGDEDQITDDATINPFLLNPELTPLPSLAFSSGSVLVGLYAVLSLILITAAQFAGLSAGGALAIAFVIVLIQFALGPFLMDLSLKWLYKAQWVSLTNLPQHLQEFIVRVCDEKNIKVPKIGMIMDGSPQAFTYGHHPNNGRIVISQGLLDLLDEEEAEAVVAHEFGHIIHWDMLIMTAAQLVPMVLYFIFRTLIRVRSRGRDKSAAARYAIAIAAYILYIISEYVVLWFSRIREYYADRFAGTFTKKPEKLASALVKIGYGLAGRKTAGLKNDDAKASVASRGLEPLGIFNAKHAQSLAISAKPGADSMGGEIDRQTLKDVAKWDLWNPWAIYYELHSTHPLIAKRIQKLSNLAYYLGKKPYIEFNDRKPESYWDDFFIEVGVYLLPRVTFICGIIYVIMHLSQVGVFGFKPSSLAFFVFFQGLAGLVNVQFSYPNKGFVPMNVKALLKKVKVSAVKPVPCRITGTIIGRGIPGLIYSEDFIMQDSTGIMFLDYRQPLGIWNFFFGLLKADKYQSKDVEVVGWYRRAPIPYIEIKEIHSDDKISKCYAFQFKLVFVIALMVLGMVLLVI